MCPLRRRHGVTELEQVSGSLEVEIDRRSVGGDGFRKCGFAHLTRPEESHSRHFRKAFSQPGLHPSPHHTSYKALPRYKIQGIKPILGEQVTSIRSIA